MADATKASTQTAYALRREGKKFGRWLEVGSARAEPDGTIRVLIDRTPTGGFNGYVHLCPIGTEPPPPPQPKPQQPATAAGEEVDEDFAE